MGSTKRTSSAPKETRRARRAKAGGGSGKPPDAPAGPGDMYPGGGGGDLDASLQVETRRRYLNYALSVITARALPDVRDGLKPVQRRILYAMANDERLWPDAKYRKSAKVVGTVIGRYHPHGDSAVYDAMVRMAQSFSLRVPLVDGYGNFGSLDGDSAAAYRYTEARLATPAMELLRELDQDTVEFRPNYDGTTNEPQVLPARFPNLLVNGSTGIAVGMATNIPPHNLREVVNALVALADDPELSTQALLKHIKGPDFPTGGEILNDKSELREIYESGRGAIRVRGHYETEPKPRGGNLIIITSVPYGLNKSTLVEKIAEVIVARKVPQLIDVRDESTDDVRVVLETKGDDRADMVMAYLYKHTPLQVNFNVNMTALVTTGMSGIGQPMQLGLKEILQQFLRFRYEVTQRRFEHELRALHKRIHLLEGFAIIFDALDETIRIIRKSDGKADAAQKLIKRFGLDEDQVDAILELRLYKLARLEINIIHEELDGKRKQAKRIQGILSSETKLWEVVKTELGEVSQALGTPRLTKIKSSSDELEFDADAYILDEDAHVVLTRDGWVKRLRELKDPRSTRVREGDEVMQVLAGSTKEAIAFFTNYGTAYVCKINDIPATTGYGEPIQKQFKFKDGERVVTAISLDPRTSPPAELLTIAASGLGQRFATEPFLQPTTRAGRRFAKVAKGDEIVGVTGTGDGDTVVVATHKGHALACMAEEVGKLENPGKGVTVIKVEGGDRVIGFISGRGKRHVLRVQTAKSGRVEELTADPRRAVGRGGKGKQLVKRTTLTLAPQPVEVPQLASTDDGKQLH